MAIESADSFIERYQATLSMIRLSDRVAVDLSATDKAGVISLDKIESHEQGKGHAKCAMRVLVSIADDFEYEIKLIPNPLDENTDKDRLVNWYKRFGFASIDDGKSMVRKAQWGRNG
jgi:hypothetical protein